MSRLRLRLRSVVGAGAALATLGVLPALGAPAGAATGGGQSAGHASSGGGASSGPTTGSSQSGGGTAGGQSADHVPSCGPAATGEARCHAIMLLDPAQNWHGQHVTPNRPPGGGGGTTTAATPAGYGPGDLQSAYQLGPVAMPGGGETVAIVDAYDDPYAASDLATYRNQYGLPALCTTSSCTGPRLTKVNQSGGTRYPKANGGWAQEISLDLDMVSAVCPECNILLVEASSSSMNNLAAAVNYAASRKPAAISNSYGSSEFSSEGSFDGYYNHPGIAVTASSGDGGYGVEYPAASPDVTAAGGTTLTETGGIWSQTAWSGAGSGCSAYEAQPSWQANRNTGCSNRAVADVSADADPNTGVAVYDSYAYQGYKGWLVFGGTSVASPIIASTYALATYAGHPAPSGADLPYSATSGLTDVTSGSNGSCSPTQLCTAGAGWDGPTGLGTPAGTAAF